MLMFTAFILSTVFFCGGRADFSPPHIIFVFADDLGWNDVSYHGSPEIPTPNIDALALSGITFERYYSTWLCSPSRGSFMTGKYPTRLGLQHHVLSPAERSGLPLNETTIAQHLKNLGYSTHAIGKWHLGYSTPDYTPLYRGFDSFFGYYNGAIDYFDHTFVTSRKDSTGFLMYGIDMNNGTESVTNMSGKYTTHVFTNEATRIIGSHDTSKPLFMYLSHTAVHSSYVALTGLEQAPSEDIKKFRFIEDINRRIHAARVWGMDESIGTVFEALQKKGMLEKTIFLFVSDNGGQTRGYQNGYSTNYPLRGGKETVLEGGVRVPAVMWSPLLGLKEPLISTQLMHVTDWLPTLYSAAGGDTTDLGTIDGIDMWPTLLDDLPSPRTEVLHIVDPILNVSSLMKDDMKIVSGKGIEELDGWHGPTGFENVEKPKSMKKWVFKYGSKVKGILKDMDKWVVKDGNKWYASLVLDCKQPPAGREICEPEKKPCLFNVKDDPCEYHDLADDYPDLVDSLMKSIEEYANSAMPPQFKPMDPRGNPICYNFTYVPFYGTEAYYKCNL